MNTHKTHVWITEAVSGSSALKAVCQDCGLYGGDYQAGAVCRGVPEKHTLTLDRVATGFAVLDRSAKGIVELDGIKPTEREAKVYALWVAGAVVPEHMVEQAFDALLPNCKLVEVRISYTPPSDES